MKIAVTGASGFLGSRVCTYYRKLEKFVVTEYTRSELDFTKKEECKIRLCEDRPDILIHTAAISDIGKCEQDSKISEEVNVEGTKNLAQICGKLGIRMVFCSSDQVYMGNGIEVPHREEGEKLSPPTLYGQQKLRAEEEVFFYQPDAVVLRLSWMFAKDFREGKEHGNLISAILGGIKNQQKMQYPVYDFRSITDVWEVIANLEKLFDAPAGIYNFGSENMKSTYEMVKILAENMKAGQDLLEKNTHAFCKRPRNLMMNIEKVKKQGVTFRTTEEAMEQEGKKIRNDILSKDS